MENSRTFDLLETWSQKLETPSVRLVFLKLAFLGKESDSEIIHRLLSPWEVSFANQEEADIIISYKGELPETDKTIVIPSDSPEFAACACKLNLRFEKKTEKRVLVDAERQTSLSISPKVFYHYEKLGEMVTNSIPETSLKIDQKVVLLTMDILEEHRRIWNTAFNKEVSKAYRLLTGLPLLYNLTPRQLKDSFMKTKKKPGRLTLNDKLPLDALRLILVGAIEKMSGKKLKQKEWSGKRIAYAITHDVDTSEGFQKAKRLKRLEEKYDLPSAWYIPTKQYALQRETVLELANHGEIGTHDTKHDGKLIGQPEKAMATRLRESRLRLENILGSPILGFRAPLLQHSLGIVNAAKKAGYKYDTSVPTWEPRHPTTMSAHGIGTTYPLNVNGLCEIPLTLPQDHQLLSVLGLTPKETVETWIDLKRTIMKVGGICTVLVHPDHKLADLENLRYYETLLNDVATDNSSWVTLPAAIVTECGLRDFE